MVPRTSSNSESQLRPQQLQRALSANSTKHSFSYRSHSSSFEADDERSNSDHEMGPDQGFRDDPSQYAGEDTRLTSSKELSGWYAYGFAAEVFVICGMGECESSFEATSVLECQGSTIWSSRWYLISDRDRRVHEFFGDWNTSLQSCRYWHCTLACRSLLELRFGACVSALLDLNYDHHFETDANNLQAHLFPLPWNNLHEIMEYYYLIEQRHAGRALRNLPPVSHLGRI
jgi:hypothetical protein